VFDEFLVKSMHISVIKTQFLGFLFRQVVQRHRWEIKYVLSAHFLGSICAKNYRNRATYVKIIASKSKVGRFFF